MNGRRALFYVVGFAGLAAVSAVVAGRVTDPSIAPLLLATAAVATLAGAPGLVRRRAWALALLLLPLGAYLLMRAQVPLPPQASGVPAHLAFYADQLGAGGIAYAYDVFPLDVSSQAGLRLLLSLVVYVTVGVAAFLALSLRRPLPAVVMLLALAGFGFTTDSSARDPWAAIAFVLFAGWMLSLSRSLGQQRRHATDALAGGVTAVLAALLALSIIGTTAVEAGRPLHDWRSWDITGPRTAKFRFDRMQNYPRLLEPANDVVVMRVRSPIASYWRASVLADFTGTTWRGGAPDGRELRPQARGGDWVYEAPQIRPAPQGRLVTQRFEIEGAYTDRLFVGGWAVEVRSALPLDLQMTSAAAVAVEPPRGPSLDYSVAAVVPDLEPTDLVGRGRYYPGDVTRSFTALPFPAGPAAGGPSSESAWRAEAAAVPAGREWLGLYALNERVVGGETDPFRVALAVEQYLRSNHDYSLRPPDAGFDSPYAEFLFATRIGYCQHFAGAMAAILRFNGIPARVAVGFTAGEEERNGIWVVTRNDAHAWVEAYFPGVGWAQFDPTPGREIPSTSTAPASGPDAAAAAGLDGAGASPAPEAAAVDGRARVADPSRQVDETVVAEEPGGRAPWLVVSLLAAAVAWPAGRALLRGRGLRRGSREDRLRASVALLYADLRDHGAEAKPSQTLDETARYLSDHLGVDAGDLPDRVQAVEFGSRRVSDADLKDLGALRRRVRRRLRERSGRLTALLALYGVRPRRRRGSRLPVARRARPATRS
ncbi:MAG TPA: transglutaminaseTgpA domain-containing protein [Thermoleophilia bacterium]|nr:transglutaminaseTgpA domain-containing protein [Thermoleophilia bacterium]